MSIPVLKLKRGEDRRLRAGHLWIFSNEVDTAATPLTQFEPGAAVQVHSDRDQFLGHRLRQSAHADRRAHRGARCRPIHSMPRCSCIGCASRWPCASACIASLITGWCTASPTDCRAWCSIVMATWWSRRAARRASIGCAPEIEAAVDKVIHPKTIVWKNDSGARELEGLTRVGVSGAASEGSRRPRKSPCASRASISSRRWPTARRPAGSTTRPRIASGCGAICPPGARVLDVCSYVGAWAITALKGGAAQRHLRGFVGDGARLCGAQCAREWCRGRDDQGRRLRCAEGAAGMRRAVRRGDPRSAGVRQAQEGRAPGAGRVSQAQPARAAADRSRWPAGVVLVLLSHGAPTSSSDAIQTAARHTSRFVQVLEQGGQSPDHPVHPAIPETRYLKSFFCRVTRE